MVVTTGNSALSKGGTGDILTGIVASFLAQGLRVEQALPLAAYAHGRAAELLTQKWGEDRSALASEIAGALTLVFEELENWKKESPH